MIGLRKTLVAKSQNQIEILHNDFKNCELK